jgi:hypothetical protein
MATLVDPTSVAQREKTAITSANGLTHEAIAVRAYFRYVERGCHDGLDLDDWLAAEQELRADEAANAEAA